MAQAEALPQPLRIVRCITTRPCCMCLLSMGTALCLLAIFALGIIFGFIEFGVDYSSGQLQIENDHVADRYRAAFAALEQSSRVGGAELLMQLEPLPPTLPPAAPLPPLDPSPAAPPQSPPPTEGRYRFQRIGRMQLFFERVIAAEREGPGGAPRSLFDGEIPLHMAALQDTLLHAPGMSELCNRASRLGSLDSSRPDGNCTGFLGVLSAMRTPRATRSRHVDVTFPRLIDPASSSDPSVAAIASATALASAALSSATSALGTINVSALLFSLSLSASSLSADLRYLADATCEGGEVESAGQSDVHLSLRGCGPLPGCCECSGSTGCFDLPLCVTTDAAVTYTEFDPDRFVIDTPLTPAAQLDRSSFLASARALEGTLNTELTCGGWNPLKGAIGWLTTIGYRNSSEPLVRFSEHIEYGGWRLEGESWSEYRPRHLAAQAAWSTLLQTHISPAIKAFNDEHGADVKAATWCFDQRGSSLSSELVSGLTDAALWSLGGIGVGSLYMSLHFRSLALPLGGLFGLFVSFPLTWFIYAAVFRLGAMGIFNFMALCASAGLDILDLRSIYDALLCLPPCSHTLTKPELPAGSLPAAAVIIVAIGVDDLYVFADAWRQSAKSAAGLEARMDIAYRRASHTMFITSITDAIAFYSNAISSVPIVRQFGIFMGTLTLVNYTLVITYFPSLIALHYRWSQARSSRQSAAICCCCIQDSSAESKPPASPSVVPATAESASSSSGSGESGSVGVDAAGSDRPTKYWTQHVEEWLSDSFVPALVRARVPVLVCGAALLASLIFSITRFTTTDKDFQYLTFPEGTNLMNYLSQLELYRDLPAHRLFVTWGVAGLESVHNPREDDAFIGDSPRWLPSFESPPAAAQAAALRLCEQVSTNARVRQDRPRTCFLPHFAAWRVEQEGTGGFPTAPSEFVPLLDLFTTFSRIENINQNNASCALLAARLSSVGYLRRTEEELNGDCEAFWRAATPFLDAGSNTLQNWAENILWSCPQREVDRKCISLGSKSSAQEYQGHSPRLLGFYATFEVRALLYPYSQETLPCSRDLPFLRSLTLATPPPLLLASSLIPSSRSSKKPMPASLPALQPPSAWRSG